MTPFQILKEKFGHSSFRLEQEEIINSILQKRDAFARMENWQLKRSLRLRGLVRFNESSKKTGGSTFGSIKALLGDSYSYGEIRIVMAHLEQVTIDH